MVIRLIPKWKMSDKLKTNPRRDGLTWIVKTKDHICYGSSTSFTRVTDPLDACNFVIIFSKWYIESPSRHYNKNHVSFGCLGNFCYQKWLLSWKLNADPVTALRLYRLINTDYKNRGICCCCYFLSFVYLCSATCHIGASRQIRSCNQGR